MLRHLFDAYRRHSADTTPESSRLKRRRNQYTLRCETLERREMNAIQSGESLVNAWTTARDQSQVATASAPDGQSVVVWTHQYSDSDTDIYAQRYDYFGNRSGTEIRVATRGINESEPDVSMDHSGSFVVTWRAQTTATNSDIVAQRFNANGLRKGSTITVAASARKEYSPSIASDATGNFVVAWTRDWSSTDQDVMARMFRSDGGAVAAEFSVANLGSLDERRPDVARAPDGRFSIAYEIDAGGGDVVLKRFSAGGSTMSTISIATGSVMQFNPRIAMDDSANTVVVWQEKNVLGDIKARYINNNGLAFSTMTVQTRVFSNPDVAMRRGGGLIVVTYLNAYSAQKTICTTEMNVWGQIFRRDEIATFARRERAAVAFGTGTEYSLSYSRSAGTQGSNIYRRQGLLS